MSLRPRRLPWRIPLLLAVATLALSAAHLTVGATVAHALPCDPADPNCPPPPPPPPPPPGPPPTPPVCSDVGPVHAWPCPVDSSVACVEAADGTNTCPPAHVGVAAQSVGPIGTPAYDTGYYTLPVPNAYGAATGAYTTAGGVAGGAVKPIVGTAENAPKCTWSGGVVPCGW